MTTGEKIQIRRANAAAQKIAAAFSCIETFVAEELECRERSMIPPFDDYETKYIDSAKAALSAVTQIKAHLWSSEMTTGEKIRAARLKAGMTQEQLAKRLGTIKSRINRLENGERQPHAYEWEALWLILAGEIAEALKISLPKSKESR